MGLPHLMPTDVAVCGRSTVQGCADETMKCASWSLAGIHQADEWEEEEEEEEEEDDGERHFEEEEGGEEYELTDEEEEDEREMERRETLAQEEVNSMDSEVIQGEGLFW